MENKKALNEKLFEAAKLVFPKTPFATKEPVNFARFGEVLVPLPNKKALKSIAADKFQIVTEGKYTYVICDELLVN